MKRTVAIVIAVCLLLTLAACESIQDVQEPTPTPEPKPATPTPEPTPEPTPPPTFVEADSRQDLIEYGFSTEEYDQDGNPKLTIESRISDSVYHIYYLDYVMDVHSVDDEGNYKLIKADDNSQTSTSGSPGYIYPCIDDSTQKIRYFRKQVVNDIYVPMIRYYPNIDRQITAAVYLQLEGNTFYDLLSEGFCYDIPVGIEELKEQYQDDKFILKNYIDTIPMIDANSYGAVSAFIITDIVSQYVDLDAVYQEAMQLYQKFEQNLMQEFSLTPEEMLKLR